MMFARQIRAVCGVLCTFAIAGIVVADDAKKTEETTTVKAGDLTLQVPKSWKQQQPSNNLRLAQFVVPASEEGLDDAELVVSGPFGGSATQNIQRWMGQFASQGLEVKMTQGTSSQGKYILVDMAGTYNRSIGPPFRRQTEAVADYRVINVMLTVGDGKGGNYFLKLTGPKKTLKGIGDQLRATFGADSKKEEPYEL